MSQDSSLTNAMSATRLNTLFSAGTPRITGLRRASYEAAGRDTVSAAATAVMPTPNSSASHHRRACSTSASAAPSAASCSRHLRGSPCFAPAQTPYYTTQTATPDRQPQQTPATLAAQTQLACDTEHPRRAFSPDTHDLAHFPGAAQGAHRSAATASGRYGSDSAADSAACTAASAAAASSAPTPRRRPLGSSTSNPNPSPAPSPDDAGGARAQACAPPCKIAWQSMYAGCPACSEGSLALRRSYSLMALTCSH